LLRDTTAHKDDWASSLRAERWTLTVAQHCASIARYGTCTSLHSFVKEEQRRSRGHRGGPHSVRVPAGVACGGPGLAWAPCLASVVDTLLPARVGTAPPALG